MRQRTGALIPLAVVPAAFFRSFHTKLNIESFYVDKSSFGPFNSVFIEEAIESFHEVLDSVSYFSARVSHASSA